jgi:hypothetical protein
VNSFGFRITHCPLYPRPEDEAETWLRENFLTQRALWNAIRSLFGRDFAASIELRFCAAPGASSISTDLIVRWEVELPEEAIVDLRNAVERLLPGEYGWSHLPADDGQFDRPWHMRRLVRRLDFFDLPTTYPLWGFGGEMDGKPAAPKPAVPKPAHKAAPAPAPANASAGGTAAAPRGIHFSDLFALGDISRRQLPDKDIPNPLQEFRNGVPLCVPILGEIENESPDEKRLLLDLMNCAPAVISITLHFGSWLLPNEEERIIATRFKLLLEPFAYSVAGAGYSSIPALLRIYDRYWLPAHRLCNLSIGVAAEHRQLARSLAHSLASQFGGLKSFEILADEKRDDLDLLWRPREEVPGPVAGDQWADTLRQKLEDAAVWDKDEPIYRRFLLRMPALYTMDEATELLRLPRATEGGLPGMATRTIPPFFSSSLDPVPFRVAPDDRVRVGLIQSSSLAQQGALPVGTKGNGEPRWEKSFWHTVRVGDLCKHALIVGSTGSGKTQTTLFLLAELARNHIPFLVIEPVKTEYFKDLGPWIPNLKRFRLEVVRDVDTEAGQA